ncbi:MAG: TlpA disulfide reductase family protein [Paludibacter sp.]|nr:TlpA disulfide reductase family protein [Paludibacter sp.]
MRKLFILLIATISLNGFAKTNETKSADPIQKPMLRTVNYDELKTILNKNDNKLYVVNFWATWCTPCVKELPDFMEVNKIYRDNAGFKMILVSLDNADVMETVVRSFLEKKDIDTDVFILDDNKRMNEWIPAIDASWSGAIPATVFYRNGKKLEFVEGKLEKSELEQLITKNM